MKSSNEKEVKNKKQKGSYKQYNSSALVFNCFGNTLRNMSS